ncbi:heparin lyase I family protein [Marinomonas sp.]|uniref:heparin lyase I family protein n=1 Tax=Marinomonas sp. TaxID=1904862 RepID=UPI003BA95A1A
MLNFFIRLICLLTASLITTPALSQDMRGWSDKTVCRLLMSKPDEPAYLEEVTSRGLSCGINQKNVGKLELIVSDPLGQSNTVSRCKHKSTIPKVTNFRISLSHEKTVPNGGCLIVGGNADVSPKDGEKMIQITVKPNSCSRDDGHDDCTSDRSRVEFYDGTGASSGVTVIYEYSMFIPKTTNLKQNGYPTVFLGQLNSVTGNHYSSPIMLTWAADESIKFQIYDDFDWTVSRVIEINNVIPALEQVDNWIDIKYEIAVYSDKRGEMKIFVNGEKVYQRLNHATIKRGGKVKLKMGIYNYKVSYMGEPRSDQVVFFDKITKTIK